MRPLSIASSSSSWSPVPPLGFSSSSSSSGGGGGGGASMSESAQMQGMDSNLEALCEHIRAEGWNCKAFSDVVVQAMGSTYYLHRLLLSRSSYFRNMLQGPWKEASAAVVRLHIDDENVSSEAVTTALGYLYGHAPKLDDGNAFRVLAAASFLDLQDLCAFCTDFIISDLWTENFLSYQAFAESQDYGVHGERVRKACWGYLCRGGAVELREILPKLSSQTLRMLLTSDELWVPSEEKRFELALSVFLARGVVTQVDSCSVSDEHSDTGTCLTRTATEIEQLEGCSCNYEGGASTDVIQAVRNIVLEMVDSAASNAEPKPCSTTELDAANVAESSSSQGDAWTCGHHEQHCPRCIWYPNEQSLSHSSWGGRVVERRFSKAYRQADWASSEDWETFMSVFEGGGIHYCHMLFDDLLDGRARLEELGFPCKSIADGLWLQTLIRQQVLTVAAETCKLCCLTVAFCKCKQSYVYPPHSRTCAPDHEKSQAMNFNTEAQNAYTSNVPVRVHVRGTNDGLAGLGRGTTSGTPWPYPSRFMLSNRNRPNKQQHLQLESERGDGDLTYADGGLNSVVGLTQGMSGNAPGLPDPAGKQPLVKEAGDSPASQPDVQGDDCQALCISLDLRTPLRSFPPFRFGVEFEDVHRLGEPMYSPEVFYAGSLWKVSVQSFNDADPHRRTVGLFLHRRKADDTGPFRKVSLYIDSREKVTARYQLICPAKRGVMVLGSLTQAGTLLPKFPKGWGWRTAFLFDELVELLQGNALRVAAVVQVV